MAETTEQYRTRINQLNASIKSEPYIEKMRNDIAEGVSKTGNRQADLENDHEAFKSDLGTQFQNVIDVTTDKDFISAPEIIAARKDKPNLNARLDSFERSTTAQFHQKASIDYVESVLSLYSGGGVKDVFYSLAALKLAHPTGALGPMLVYDTSHADGAHQYTWVIDKWKDIGLFNPEGIADKSITFPKLSKKVNDAINYPATNLIKNGDFSKGTTDWKAEGGTGKVLYSTYSTTGDGTIPRVGIRAMPFTGKAKNKIYVSARIRVTNNDSRGFSVYATDGETQAYMNNEVVNVLKPIANSWQTPKGVIELPSSFAEKDVYVYFVARYADGTTATNKVTEIYRTLAIDLTDTFGVGKEPSIEETADILSSFAGSWFDGTTESLTTVRKQLESKTSVFEFNKLDKRVTETEREARYPATNLLLNGGFRDGKTGWNDNGGVGSIFNNTYTVVGDSSFNLVGIRTVKEDSTIGKGGHKYFMESVVRVTNGDAESLGIHVFDGTDIVYLDNEVKSIIGPKINVWYTIYGIVELPVGMEDKQLQTYISARYPVALPTQDKTTEVYGSNVMIDLTEVFGKGNEPEKDMILEFMKKYDSNWFDGSVGGLVSMKDYIEAIRKKTEKALEVSNSNYTTVPTYVDGKITKAEELDGIIVKKRTILTYSVNGDVQTVKEEIEGKTIVSTIHYTDGVFTSITKKTETGGL